MKNKALIGLIATATIGTAITIPVIKDNQNTTHIINKVLMVNNTNNSSTNEAVVINGNSNMNLYALSNGSGIVSNLSVGEMLTVLGQSQNGYCKVKVQETGAIGYVNVDNMQDILNGTNDTFTQLSGTGQVINVSSNVRLRSIPAIGNNIICHLTNGTSLNILGKQGQWYKVSVNGQIGFIYEEYVSTNITDSISQSATNNNINTKASATSTSSSTSSSINSNKHTKKVVTRTKSSITSNSSSNINNNIKNTSNNSSKKIKNVINITIPKNEKLFLFAKPNSPNIVDALNGKLTLSILKEENGWSYVEGQDYNGYVPNIVLKSAINGKNLMSAYKEVYENTLNSLEQEINSWKAPTSTNQSMEQSHKASELWGNELNNIYNNLLYFLPKNNSESLKKSQEIWIKKVLNNINKMKNDNGNVGVMNAYNKATTSYKNRCYYLINEYM